MQTSKDKRIDFRISEIDKNLLEKAAAYTGDSVSTFVLRNALNLAREIVSEHQSDLALSEKDQRLFYDLILNPPAPSDYLLKSVKEHMSEGSISEERAGYA